MSTEDPSTPATLAARPAGATDRHAVILTLLGAVLLLVIVMPFRELGLARAQNAIRFYQSALVIADLAAAALLLGQLALHRSRALRLLACGYLFAGVAAFAHLLVASDTPNAATPQVQMAAWLSAVWHAGFPLFVIAYARLYGHPRDALPARSIGWDQMARDALCMLVPVAALMLAATLAQQGLPPLVEANGDGTATLWTLVALQWLLCLVAIVLLWWRRAPSVLDLWLIAVMALWLCEGVLAATFNAGHVGLGSYRSRIFGLLAASVLPVLLLRENLRVTVRLIGQQRTTLARLAEAETRTRTSARDRDDALQALRDKEAELRAIVAHLADAIVITDSEGRVRSANPALQAILGRGPETVIGRPLAQLLQPADAVDDDGTRIQAVALGVAGLVYGRHADGRPIALAQTSCPLQIQGRPLQLHVLHDLREQLRSVGALNDARREAESASQAKSAFLATMSHEMRTPMNGVIGMVDVLQQTPLSESQREMLDLVRASAVSLQDSIDGILDVSKIETGRLRIARAPLALADVVARAGRMTAPGAEQVGVALHLAVDPALPVRVFGDADRLHQLLVHLLGNAVKFSTGTGRPGQVTLRAAPAEGPGARAWVAIDITDNGIGMAPETVAALFAPFMQAETSTTRRYGGTGLGLAICHGLVEQMGGSIEVVSTLGQGSCFSVRLPFEVVGAARPQRTEEPPRSPRPPVPLAGAAAGGGLILAAEDHATNRQVLRKQLQLLGCQVELVENGRAALERWRAGGLALLLTDLHMPEMDGYALARAIRAEEPAGSRLPIVALTANAQPDDLQRCLDAGMDAFLTKPVALDAMHAMLARWLPQGNPGSAAAPGAAEAAPGSAGAPTLDLSVLQSIVGEDPQVVMDILRDFKHNAAQDAQALRAACSDGAGTTASAVAHKLKSSARSVGALQLGALCEELEHSGAQQHGRWLQAWSRRFDAEMEQVEGALSQALRADPAAPC